MNGITIFWKRRDQRVCAAAGRHGIRRHRAAALPRKVGAPVSGRTARSPAPPAIRKLPRPHRIVPRKSRCYFQACTMTGGQGGGGHPGPSLRPCSTAMIASGVNPMTMRKELQKPFVCKIALVNPAEETCRPAPHRRGEQYALARSSQPSSNLEIASPVRRARWAGTRKHRHHSKRTPAFNAAARFFFFRFETQLEEFGHAARRGFPVIERPIMKTADETSSRGSPRTPVKKWTVNQSGTWRRMRTWPMDFLGPPKDFGRQKRETGDPHNGTEAMRSEEVFTWWRPRRRRTIQPDRDYKKGNTRLRIA